MAAHSHAHSIEPDVTRLRPGSKMLGLVLMAVGVLLLAGAVVITGLHDVQRFFFAYLFGITGFLMISCAALVFTLISHLVRAGWIISVRRVLDTITVQLPLLALLLVPVVATVALKSSTTVKDEHGQIVKEENGEEKRAPVMYPFARPTDTPVEHHHGAHEDAESRGNEATPGNGAPTDAANTHPPEATHSEQAMQTAAQHEGARSESLEPAGESKIEYPNEQVRPGVERGYDELIAKKSQNWLNPTFWTIRVVFYLLALSGIAWYFWNRTVVQDRTGDIDISENLMVSSGPLLAAAGTIISLLAFDVYMALDPHWFSTMYGVYFFASGTQAMWAVMALAFLILQSRGYLRSSVSTEHYHDIGKYMFAFVIFFAYIGFSQYMLQWYANLPEETFFYDKRGYSTGHPNGYTPLVLILLIGRFCIPFLGLVSRHAKRNRFALGFWAVWLIVNFFVDVYLLVMPEYHFPKKASELLFGLPEILCLVGAGALWLGNIIRTLANHELRPIRDPRAHESLAYVNVY